MRLPYWLHNLLRPREVPRLENNPYGMHDGLNPKYLMWELYRELISMTEDERDYLFGAVRHLRRHGQLLEEYANIDEEIKKPGNEVIVADPSVAAELKEFGLNLDLFGYSDGPDSGTTLFLYRDNLVRVKLDEDQTASLDFYHPVSKPCVIDDFKDWIIPKRGESRVSVLITRNGSLVASNIAFSPPVIDDLELNYGTGFRQVHERIMERLGKRRAGIGILHGEPGTGKSFYLKYLSSIIEREFIFVPVNMSDRLGSPEFIQLLLNKKGAILILEDAEQAVQQRGGSGNDSAVATLLNISDGILGSMLDITLIVTYNADRQHIDKALLRKGRLLFDHDFGALKTDDARRLAAHLKKDIKVTGPMTLADIYGVEEETGYTPVPTREVGFHALLSSETPKSADK